jgi:SulP family sulfate permease
MGLDVAIIGNIPEGLPALHFDALDHIDFSDPMLIIIPGLTLAALGTIDGKTFGNSAKISGIFFGDA